MRNLKKTEKSEKNQKNGLIFNFLKKKFLYEAEKKIIKKDSFFEHFFCLEENISSKKEKKNDKAAEKALNNKEALTVRTPVCVVLKPKSNNSIDFPVRRVNCPRQRIHSCEKPEHYNRPFNRKYNTNNIFCVKKG